MQIDLVKYHMALKTFKDNEVSQVLDTEGRGVIRQLMARRNLEAQVTLLGAVIT